MPWITDKNNEKSYKPSIYAKEELPTWSEVYDDFFKKKYFEDRSINPDDVRWTEVDPYWKIPRYQFLIATICNQFNKMLFEDGFKSKLIRALVDKGVIVSNKKGTIINDIKFLCNTWSDEDCESVIQDMCISLNCAPPIYTIPHPDGKENPFITDYKRIDITKLDKPMLFRPVIDLVPVNGGSQNHIIYEPLPEGDGKVDFDAIMEIMIAPFLQYFEGESVGWKDETGKSIQKDTRGSKKCPSGFDPAL